MESTEPDIVQTRGQQQGFVIQQQQQRLDSRSPATGSTEHQRNEIPLLPSDQIVHSCGTNATDGDELRSSNAQSLYGRPTWTSIIGNGVEKNACYGKLRRRIRKRGNVESSSKWGAKRARTAFVSSAPANHRDLGMLDGNWKGPRQKHRQALHVVRQGSEGNSCVPKMISNETSPMVARMGTCSKTLPQSPAGPVTPVPLNQKKSQKRKSLSSLDDGRPLRPNLGSGEQGITFSPAGKRSSETSSVALVVDIPLQPRELFPSHGQEVLADGNSDCQSLIAFKKFQAQPVEWKGSALVCALGGNQNDNANVQCDRMMELSADLEQNIWNRTGYPNGIQPIEGTLCTPIQRQPSHQYVEGGAPYTDSRGNRYSYHLNGHLLDIVADAEVFSIPCTPLKFKFTRKTRSKLRLQVLNEQEILHIAGEETVPVGYLCGADACPFRSVEDVETERLKSVKSRSRRGTRKALDLNKPASHSAEPSIHPSEEPPDPSQKRSKKKHSRPRVLKDVTKPVRVPKPKKASNSRRVQSTKPRRTKKSDSQAAEMKQQTVFEGTNCSDGQVDMRDPENPLKENSSDSSSRPWRMRAAARSGRGRISIQTVDGDSIRAIQGVAMSMADLKLVDTLSKAIVPFANTQRAIVLHAKPRQKAFKPKVQLEDGDLQWWKLVMTHGPSYENKSDEATSGKWADERALFKLRADKFIELMHQVQGNRRFSKWKGSIIDSVVGAFLTQNVSDHLSSSAFMLLASRFPVAVFEEVRVEETSEAGESYTDATPLRTRHADQDYLVEEPTTEEEPIVEERPVVEIPSTVEELEREHMDFWHSARKDSLQVVRTILESQYETGHIRTNDLRCTSSGVFKIRDGLGDENPPSCNLSQKEGTRDSLAVNGLEEAIVGSLSVDPVQSTAADQLPSVRGTSSGVFKIRDGLGDENSPSCNLSQEDGTRDSSAVNGLEEAIVGSPSVDRVQSTAVDQLPSVRCTSSGVFQIRDGLGDENSPSCNVSQEDGTRDSSAVNGLAETIVGNPSVDSVQSTAADQLPSVIRTSSGVFKIRVGFGDENSPSCNVSQEDGTRDFSAVNGLEEAIVGNPSVDPVQSTAADQVPSVRRRSSGVFKIRVGLGDENSPSCNLSQEDGARDSSAVNGLEEGIVGNPSVDPVQSTATDHLPSVRRTSSGVFKIRDGLGDGNSPSCKLSQEDGTRESLAVNGLEEAIVGNFFVDPVQSTAADQLPSETLSTVKEQVKISYIGLTGSERAKLEQTKTKSKDKVDWEAVRQSCAKQSSNGASPSSVEDAVDWETVRVTDVDQIAEVIKERGMNNMLAGRIKGFLNRVQTYHGSLDLEWLRDLQPEDAKKFLLSIHGLGLKSVECVRLLTLHHLAFPVDTNVGRICVRLGWVPIEPLPEVKLLSELETYPVQENIQKYLWPRLCTLDQPTLYELHYQMITFGKVFCTKRDPNCNACPLRNDCRHYADSMSRSRKREITLGTDTGPRTSHQERLALPPATTEILSNGNQPMYTPSICEPIIEEPSSPARYSETREEELVENHKEETVPEVTLHLPEFPANALVIVPPEVAAQPVPKLKSVGRLRTVHYVYELKDDHPLVHVIGARVADDPCPILLAIWGPGESPDTDVASNEKQSEVPETSNDREDTVKGTLLVPCRTANRGSFPLNGTYFQVNEVFADHHTSINPMDVPRRLLWNLTRKFVYFGTSVTSIFKGLSVDEITYAFQSGYVCVRGFDSKTRAPKPLQVRLHAAASVVNKRRQKQPEKPGKNDGEIGHVTPAPTE